MLFRGVGMSPGLAIARCYVFRPAPAIDPVDRLIEPEQAGREFDRFRQAVQQAAAHLETVAVRARQAGDMVKADMIGVQCLMLADPAIEDSVREKITRQFYPASRAVSETIREQATILAELADPYLKERAVDVRDIGSRLLAFLRGGAEPDLPLLTDEVILVAREITVSQLASLDETKVKGIVAELGGKTSHAAILANHLGLPVVSGCLELVDAVDDGEYLLVNGDKGTVESRLSPAGLAEAGRELERRDRIMASLLQLVEKPTRTLDGSAVSLTANIVDSAGAAKAAQVGADGIGLYRTEFLFMDRASAPTEDEQYEAYAGVLRVMRGKPVIIRTLDIGGDKNIAYLDLPPEANPFLGYRAIRICLQEKKLFLTQLRAILRAALHGRAFVMYPMIASPEELREANQLLQTAKESLRAEGIPYDDSLQAGIMVEVPAAAVAADLLIRDAAFFSIGSNDLTQYALAADRLNEKVGQLYSPFHPGVLRLIRLAIETANSAGGGKFAGMCGELAAEPLATLLLLGMGLREFSVNPSALLKIKKIILSVDLEYARQVAANAMQLSTVAEIKTYLSTAIPAELQDYL